MSLRLKYTRIILFFILTTCIFSKTEGQKKDLFVYYDSLTYSQYQQKNWKKLVKSSGEALRAGFDYYYLRMRAGIALYERENYLLAEKQFRKALKMNQPDAVSRQYIYYSKLFAGKEKESSVFYKHHEYYLKDKVDSELKPIRNFFLDMAYHFKTDENSEFFSGLETFNGATGYQSVTQNFINGSFFLVHDIGRYFTLSHGGTYLRKNNYLYLIDPQKIILSRDHRVNQIQYFGGLSLFPGANFSISSSIHYLYLSSPDLIYRSFGLSSRIEGIHDNSFAGRFSMNKYFNLFGINAGLSLSNLHNHGQFQKDIALTFYPLGNQKLYSVSSFYHVRDKGFVTTSNYLSYEQEIGIKIANGFWGEISYWNGDIKNLIANDGFVVYNGNETINSRYNLSFIVPLTNLQYTFSGSYLAYTSQFVDNYGDEQSINVLHLEGLTLILELKWRF